MNDKQFLLWLHERLEYKHKENPLNDYMIRLRILTLNASAYQKSQFIGFPGNDSDDLREIIKNEESGS